MSNSHERAEDPCEARPPMTEAEEIHALFHRLWSRASTGDRTYVKAEWKRLAALLGARGIRV